jgi:hypothetical protein
LRKLWKDITTTRYLGREKNAVIGLGILRSALIGQEMSPCLAIIDIIGTEIQKWIKENFFLEYSRHYGFYLCYPSLSCVTMLQPITATLASLPSAALL